MRIADGKLVKLQHANERKTLSLHVGGVNLKITRFFTKKKEKKRTLNLLNQLFQTVELLFLIRTSRTKVS